MVVSHLNERTNDDGNGKQKNRSITRSTFLHKFSMHIHLVCIPRAHTIYARDTQRLGNSSNNNTAAEQLNSAKQPEQQQYTKCKQYPSIYLFLMGV